MGWEAEGPRRLDCQAAEHVLEILHQEAWDGAVEMWLFLKIKGPFFGSPCNKSSTILGSIVGP